MKTLKDGTRNERIENLKRMLKVVGGNLITDGAHLARIISLSHCHGLDDLKITEIKEIVSEVHEAEVRSIAEWSLQFEEGVVRDVKIMNEVIEALEGDFNYEVVREINKVAYELSRQS